MPASRSRGEGTSTTPRRSDFVAAADVSHAAVASRAGRVGAVPVCIMAALSLFLASSQFRFERQQSWTSGGIHCMTIEAQMSIHEPGVWRQPTDREARPKTLHTPSVR